MRAIHLHCLAYGLLGMLVMCVIFWSSAFQSPAVAQEIDGAWTKPVAIVETDGRLVPGAMASDSQGNLHVLFTHTPDKVMPIGIDYLYWNGADWSTPVSVLINPDGSNVLLPQLVIDRRDVMHVVWIGGGTLYYAASPAATAGSVRSWAKPVAIGETLLTSIGMVAGPNDDLYVAYSDSSQPGRIVLITSTDGGKSWSTPVLVAQTELGTVPGDVQLAMDDSGRLHATWTVYSLAEGNWSLGAFYSHTLGNQIAAWDTPHQFAGPRHGEASIVTVGENEVHMVWQSNIGGDGTFHQWSNDGGTTWFNPDRYDNRGGFSGLPYFAIDSLKRVHYTIGPVFYTMWSKGRLDPYQDVATAAVRGAATVSMGEGAILSITKGNRLHVIFHTDFKHLWYTTKLLSVPEINPSAIEVSQPTATPSLSTLPISETSIVTQPGRMVLAPKVSNDLESQSLTYLPILLSIVPAVLLIVSMLLIHQSRRRR